MIELKRNFIWEFSANTIQEFREAPQEENMGKPFSNNQAAARDLKARLEGEVLSDDLSRAAYSNAACIYRLLPLLIVQPRHREDVMQWVRYAAERGIPITARGAGTGQAGQGIGEGILQEFLRLRSLAGRKK